MHSRQLQQSPAGSGIRIIEIFLTARLVVKRQICDLNKVTWQGHIGAVVYFGIEVRRLDLVIRKFFVGPDGNIFQVDFGIVRITNARLQRTAEVVLPAESRIVVTILGSRDVDGECKAVFFVDRGRRPIAAPVQTIGHHFLISIVIHTDAGAAGDRLDDGIGITAGRDAHANTASTVRHLGAVFSSGNRARLEEQIGISVPQPIVRREIIGAQLLKVNLEFYGRLALSDDKSLKAVRARHVGI